jgi:hypothetical protein
MPSDAPEQPQTLFAYLAGLIDGDGAVGIIRHNRGNHTRRGWYHPYIQISTTDESTMKSLKDDFGGQFFKLHSGRTQFGRRPMFAVRWGYRQAYNLAKATLPFLRIKRSRAVIIVRWYEEGAHPSGANWRWHPEKIIHRQVQLYKEMRDLQLKPSARKFDF